MPQPDSLPTPSLPGRRPGAPAKRIDPGRYRKVRRFFARTLLHAFWWEVVLNQPVLRRFRTPWLPRYAEVARRYRELAIELGGVLIKLGQFLSARVDVLPRDITQVLAELQDEVPPEPFERIAAEIEADLGAPVDDLFTAIDPEVLGAASLAQVHRAVLPDGREAVIKVLRPGIDVLVETDLAALGFAVRWLRLWKPVRRRVNLHRLIREFTQTTRRELDMQIEGRSAERFARNFADDPTVRAPEIVWDRSGERTLTMENVRYIKIQDHATLDAAGIDRRRLAAKVYRTYMEQIFVHNFVHADPHPGNIFVRPLDGADGPVETADGESDGGRDFELVFVDFGMMAEIPERLRESLREYAIGLGTRDPQRVVQSYMDAGLLLPGADLERLVEIHEDLFDRFYGVSLGRMQEVALSEARYFLREYWDVIRDLPFQAQTDLIFVGRAMGLLSGLATSLAPDFDVWTEAIPFAEKLAKGELGRGGTLWQTVADQGRVILGLPGQASRFYSQATRGQLRVEADLSSTAEGSIRRLERAVTRLSWFFAATGFLVGGIVLQLGQPDRWWGLALIGFAAAAYLWGLIRR